jgi:putative membrane protein
MFKEVMMTRHLLTAVAITAALALPATAAWAKDNKPFMRGAIQGNLAEVSFGHLAQDRSHTDGVKAVGKMLVQDHSAANRRARRLARQIGATLPNRPNAKQRAMHDHLAGLHDGRFDRRFIRDMIDDHKQDIAKYQEQARSGGGRVATFAKETLPTLEKHLHALQNLQGKMTAQRY